MEAARVEPAPESFNPSAPERSGIPPEGEALPAPKRRGGRVVRLGDDREWTIPTLSLGQIHGPAVMIFSRVLKFMILVAEAKVPESIVVQDLMGGVIELAWLALTRNYPTLGLTIADVGELLDQHNAIEVLQSIYDLNGFVLEVLRRLGITPTQRPSAPVASVKGSD